LTDLPRLADRAETLELGVGMGTGGRFRVSPSMAVALTALVVAAGGSALAASGGFEDGAGTIQGCVAQATIVSDVTDGVDQVTGGVLTPLTGTVNTAVGGLSPVTSVVTPKGAVIVVAPGSSCPAGFTPQRIAAADEPAVPVVHAARNTRGGPLGKIKTDVVGTTVPAGSYLVTATVDVVTDPAKAGVRQVVECALADAAGVIPGTASEETIPPGEAADSPSTIAISQAVASVPAGQLEVVCKDTDPVGAAKTTTTRSVRGLDVNGDIPGQNASGIEAEEYQPQP
jgi:hypothetical protein